MRTTSVLLVGCAALLAVPRAASAQGTIAGTVRDSATNAPLARVAVTIADTRLSAETDEQGRYAIPGVSPGTHRLRARRLGYAPGDATAVVQDGQQTVADFQLKASPIELNPIVAVGYGTQRRGDVTGSVGSVSSRQIATLPVPRIEQAIAGLVSGVQVQTTNAQPGSELRIRVRGSNSLEASNEPLVVVDGVIGADLNHINPSDIQSVDVLKDISASAIYGARGANGVILVTTKGGAPGQMSIGYSGYTGMQEVTKHIDVLNADEFARLYMRSPSHDASITYDTLRPLPSTDWQDVVYQAAPIRNHELRVSGTTGATRLMLSGAWFDQEGIVLGSGLTRGSLRFNLDQDLSERFRFGARATYSRSVGDEVRVNDGYGSAGGPITMMALRFPPTIPVYDANGNFSGPLLPSQTNDNPLAIATLRDDKTTTDYVLGHAFGEYDLVPGITARTSLSYTSRARLNQRYTSRLLRTAFNTGQANIDNNRSRIWLSENTVTLRRTLADKHDVTILGGFTAQETRTGESTQQGVGFATDLLGYRRLNLAETVTGGSSAGRQRLVSFLGRVNYGFAGKYLVTGTFRTDGSSKFAANNKWASFPSAAVAWRVSEEPFFRRLAPAVNDLKLRFSAGRSGSEAIDPYESLAAWTIGSIYAIGTATYRNGVTPSRNQNPNLRWETTTGYDAGLDLGLLDDRVRLTADAYHKVTRDLLYGKLVPYFTGFESYVTNIGKVQNRGLELALDTRHTTGAVELHLGGSLSFNRSKVLDLGGDRQFFLAGANGSLPTFRESAIVRVGEPLGNFYGYIWDGIFQNQAELDAVVQPGERLGGDKVRDINGRDSTTGLLTGKPDGLINDDDRTILGNGQPRYLVGLTGSVVYKALSLSWILRGALDFQVVNLNRQGMETPGGSSNQLRSVLDYWTPTNPTNKMTALDVGPFSGMTSRWIEEGSFVRLQNVTLDWTVPRRLIGRLGMEQVHVYLSGQNLFTFTRYSWYDPEASSRDEDDLELGWDDSSYPGLRTITLGMNVRF